MATILRKLRVTKLPWTCDQCGHLLDVAEGTVYFMTRNSKDSPPDEGTIRCRKCPSKVQMTMPLADFVRYFPEGFFEAVRDTSGFASLTSRLTEAESDADRIAALEQRVAALEKEMARWWEVLESARNPAHAAASS